MYPDLPNNRLILNGHKILTISQLFAYIAKRLAVPDCHTIEDMKHHLGQYQHLIIAIWHPESFLSKESEKKRTYLVDVLHQSGTLHPSYDTCVSLIK